MSKLFRLKPLSQLQDEAKAEGGLHRTLSARALVALGIGAIIGAGLFSLTGYAAADHAGPAVVLSFVLAAIACGFAGLCYSEFSAMIPIAGSAYTYSYATLGEFIAWIIGWDLVLEYAMGAATVAISWTQYFVDLLADMGINFPMALAMGPWESREVMVNGVLTEVTGIVNLPAMIIVVILSTLLIIGTRESARINNIMVLLKVGIILVFIGVGVAFILPENWVPFVPENTGTFGEFGWSGVLRGAGIIFFAYIGFDAVSTAAQEAKNPGRDMPIGIIGSLLICTALYVIFGLVMTGMAHYSEYKNSLAPIAIAINKTNITWLSSAIKVAVLAGYSSVILVMLLGQSRVFFSMSKDGLLPGLFSQLHSRYRTPFKSNIVFMVLVALFAGFIPGTIVGEMVSIGTLLAFALVCAGVLVLRRSRPDLERPFKTPLVPFVPIMGVLVCLLLMVALPFETWGRLLGWLALGVIIYFGYSRTHSKLAEPKPSEKEPGDTV